MKFLKPFAILAVVVASGWLFHLSSIREKAFHDTVAQNLVTHPEFIPAANDVRLVSSGFDNMIADFYWLSAIQYVGENAFGADYKKYLYELLTLVTDLHPHFTTPYEVGLLLLPEMNARYETITDAQQKANIEKGIMLGERGMSRTCDAAKISRILAEPELAKVWTDPSYANPCANPMLPYYLAYVEYYDKQNPEKSSDYYRIAAANSDAPTGARIMSAIMRGKSGNREKSILMFLSIAESLAGEKAAACGEAARLLRSRLLVPFAEGDKGEIPGEFIKKVDELRVEAVGKLQEKIDSGTSDMACSTHLGKAVRELNLEYLVRKDREFVARTGKTIADAYELKKAGGIDYLPKDFQKLDEDDLEIIYVKNEDGSWDYMSGKY